MQKEIRYNLFWERQGSFVWGDEYQPGIFANRVEGPKCSRLTQLACPKLNRIIHLLSSAERCLALLALYNPKLFDLHEQRVLSPLTAPHPLHGHPFAAGMVLPNVLGTVEVAMKHRGRHERVQVTEADKCFYVPYPYLGDLLLYLRSETGFPYCVNWTIKADKGDFTEKRATVLKNSKGRAADRAKAIYRQTLEEEHYSAARIRTIQLTPSDIDQEVRLNLDFLYPWLNVKTSVQNDVIAKFDDEVLDVVSSGGALSKTINKYAKQFGDRPQFLARVYQNIWYRQLHVNLFRPLLIDKPFSTEKSDVLEVYKGLFTEKAL